MDLSEPGSLGKVKVNELERKGISQRILHIRSIQHTPIKLTDISGSTYSQDVFFTNSVTVGTYLLTNMAKCDPCAMESS